MAGLLILLAGCGKSAAPPDKTEEKDAESGVTLTLDQAKSLGITTAPAQAATWRRKLSGYGVVVALDTIAQSDADVATASAAAAQSGAAAARARSLATGEEAAVSKEVVEAANAKASADQTALMLARRKYQAAFGLHAPWHGPADRNAIMAKLSTGKAVLIRVTFPLGLLGGLKPQQIAISRLGNAPAVWNSSLLWEAPADPSLPGQGFYCLLEGSDLAQNEHVTATVDVGGAMQGVLVPQAAVLIGESDTWAFVEPKAGHFEKVRIDTSKPLSGGYFVSGGTGIEPGQAVVNGSAGLLLAREANPATGAGD
jgi:hypothetical protein